MNCFMHIKSNKRAVTIDELFIEHLLQNRRTIKVVKRLALYKKRLHMLRVLPNLFTLL